MKMFFVDFFIDEMKLFNMKVKKPSNQTVASVE
jgi:hypothetical protein